MYKAPDTMMIFEIEKSTEVSNVFGIALSIKSRHPVKRWNEIAELPFLKDRLGDEKHVYFHWIPSLLMYAITKEEYMDDDTVILALAQYVEPLDREAVDHLANM